MPSIFVLLLTRALQQFLRAGLGAGAQDKYQELRQHGFSTLKKRLKTDLLVYNPLITGSEKAVRLFSETNNDRTRGSEHQPEHRKFQLDANIFFFLL